jgi:hypothetical protein
MAIIIQTKNLSKSYGKTQVLKNIDLTIDQGGWPLYECESFLKKRFSKES